MVEYTQEQIFILEKCLDDLSLAKARNDDYGMQKAIELIGLNSNNIVAEAKVQIKSDNRILWPIDADIKLMFGDALIVNAKGYEKVVDRIVRGYYSQKISETSIRYIYYNQKPFEASTVISGEGKGEFRVADLLSVAGYAIKIAESISPDKRTESASAAITVFKGIELALNNNKTEQPIRKLLHFANDFLASVVKSHIKEDEGKYGVVATSIMVDLAIDFLCKK